MDRTQSSFFEYMRNSGYTLSTAESCTGGLVGHLVTDISGSSAFYKGGIIAYANAVKVEHLGIDPGLIDEYGAVSEPVAEAMALGVRKRFGTDLGISTTGVAGPGGGTVEKPVGLVYIGLALHDRVRVETCLWPYDRAGNKEASAMKALQMVIDPWSGPEKS